MEPDRTDRHWADPAADAAVAELDVIRSRYRRWQRRRESILGRASRKLRRFAERRLARPVLVRDRLSAWWTWAAILGAVETTGRATWFADLAPASSAVARLVSDAQRTVPDLLGRLATADPVTGWLAAHADTAAAATAGYPLTLVACTVVLRRTRGFPPMIRTPLVVVAGIVGLLTAAAYGWHLLATRFGPLADAITRLSPAVTIAVAALTPLLVRAVAGPARRI